MKKNNHLSAISLHLCLLLAVVGNEILGCANTPNQANNTYDQVMYDAARDGGKTRDQAALKQAIARQNNSLNPRKNKPPHAKASRPHQQKTTPHIASTDSKLAYFLPDVQAIKKQKIYQNPQNKNLSRTAGNRSDAQPKVIWEEPATKPKITKSKWISRFKKAKKTGKTGKKQKKTSKSEKKPSALAIEKDQKTPENTQTKGKQSPSIISKTKLKDTNQSNPTPPKTQTLATADSVEIKTLKKETQNTQTPISTKIIIDRILDKTQNPYAKILKLAMLKAATVDADLIDTDLQNASPKYRQVATKFNRLLRRLLTDIIQNDGQISFQRVMANIDLGGELPAIQVNQLTLCQEVQGFGVYTPFKSLEFLENQEQKVVLYAQIDDYQSIQTSDGQYTVNLTQEVNIYNLKGKRVGHFPMVRIDDTCRTKRRDFFVGRIIIIPRDLAPGQYVIKIRMVDINTHATAESPGVEFKIQSKATAIATKTKEKPLKEMKAEEKDAYIQKLKAQLESERKLRQEALKSKTPGNALGFLESLKSINSK